MLGYGKFISPEGIRALKNYAYKPGHYTAIDNAMQPFWNTFVKLFPMVNSRKSGWDFLVDGSELDYLVSNFLLDIQLDAFRALRCFVHHGISSLQILNRRFRRFYVLNIWCCGWEASAQDQAIFTFGAALWPWVRRYESKPFHVHVAADDAIRTHLAILSHAVHFSCK